MAMQSLGRTSHCTHWRATSSFSGAPYGMEKDAVWVSTVDGRQNGGWGLSMTLRDYGRFGLFFLGDGQVDGHEVLPPGWTKAAATAYTKRAWGDDEYWGYGYLWWPILMGRTKPSASSANRS
jgi:CubicO group peptidase (beta-lactamase class C family)